MSLIRTIYKFLILNSINDYIGNPLTTQMKSLETITGKDDEYIIVTECPKYIASH